MVTIKYKEGKETTLKAQFELKLRDNQMLGQLKISRQKCGENFTYIIEFSLKVISL